MGQAKLLQHKENKRTRFLFRQEKTLKIRANHIGGCIGGAKAHMGRPMRSHGASIS